jgi:hypothetical protein
MVQNLRHESGLSMSIPSAGVWQIRNCSMKAPNFVHGFFFRCHCAPFQYSCMLALVHRYRLLISMPGVGAILACTLIALLPELGRMSRKQVAALVGVAPYAFESGKLKGARCIWGGRAHIRRVLYMAAMSASNWNAVLKAFHDRLVATGKKPKVVIVAVMRKMITMLNAMVRDDVVWAGRLSGRHSVPTAR